MEGEDRIAELEEQLKARDRQILNLAELLDSAMKLIKAHNIAGYDEFWRRTGQQKDKEKTQAAETKL